MTRLAIDTQRRAPAGWDAVVVGSGPAGSTAARLLASWGHRVLVLTRDRPARRPIAESLPPSCRRLYRHLGIEEAIDGAGFHPTTGNTVWWGEAAPRVERFPGDETGHQVSSEHLERVLLDLAAAAGAEVRRGRGVRGVEGLRFGDAPASDVPPSVAVIEPDNPQVSASWVLDASGRAGVIGRRLRRRVESTATLALTARFESESWQLEDPSHTLVESYADGWAWSVPLSATERFAAVMVHPRRTELDRSTDRDALFDAELGKTHALRRVFRSARRAGRPLACDASGYTSERFCGRGFFLLGDAGSFIDPLSSYGVKKAMTSGWLAAVCTHTCLVRPELERHALELFERRERQVFDSYSRLSADYSRLAGSRHDSTFWGARADHEPAEEVAGAELDPSRLRADPQVHASFAEIRRLRSLALRRGPGVAIEQRPLVSGNEVVLADHLVCPWAPEGVRFLRGVDLTRLVSLAPGARTVPDLIEAYDRSGNPAPLPDLLASLAVSLAKGILVHSPD